MPDAAPEADEFDPPFEILAPHRARTALVFNSPHSGRIYPPGFLAASRLSAAALRRSEDAHVDALFGPAAAACGAPLMRAHFPRAYLDVNREPYELDPRMFEGRLPAFANTRSLRVAGGLGTIARVVGEAQEIYARRLPVAEALRRIETLYMPYHAALRRLVEGAVAAFGTALLIDCHSMPASSTKATGERFDVVLGDRFGASASPFLCDLAEAAFRAAGYKVSRNKPYAGGFITEHYGRPARGAHALQIEIARDLYMDERTLEPGPSFARLQDDLAQVAALLAEALEAGSSAARLAAE